MTVSTSISKLLLLVSIATLCEAALISSKHRRELQRVSGEKSGKYIVTLKEGIEKAHVIGSMSVNVTDDWDVIPGFAVDGTDRALDELLSHPDVEVVQEDGMVHAFSYVTQTNAPWGLARLSASGPLPPSADPQGYFSYTYDDSAGEGVDVYVVDTGIYVEHVDFGGRAVWGATFGGYASQDGNGHGTHVAGTIAGTTYGVAKKARVIAVKVLSDSGSGSFSNVISGLNYVYSSAQASGRPSVANLAIGGSASSTVDSAVTSLTNAGIHVTAAAPAGSSSDSTSPARVPSVITVGAVDIRDRAGSSFGSSIDIWAPGVTIRSAWITSPSASVYLSGTSMATAHISGLIAYFIGLFGPRSPASMSNLLQGLGQAGVLTGVSPGTVNIMAHNGA